MRYTKNCAISFGPPCIYIYIYFIFYLAIKVSQRRLPLPPIKQNSGVDPFMFCRRDIGASARWVVELWYTSMHAVVDSVLARSVVHVYWPGLSRACLLTWLTRPPLTESAHLVSSS